MNTNILRKITLSQFDNRLGLEIGLKIHDLAKQRNQQVAIQVERLNHIIFTYIDNDLPADKHLWIKRKANVAKHFEESSLSVKHDLINGNMSLKETFALDEDQYLAKGGSIPIFVENAGMVATITVSGLSDEEDHFLILEAMKTTF
ncbi:heme-binding protein [Flammeovirga pacifica]|uniref:Heme-degrading domain-containing protein n=1 Tax=Flammeovirga pacifica TaxID=915059 RepID=A0A1S1Z208_FLAPC|nr:heme-binding protein [Flammeovirga pacifica]OHX67309.1 hypothetical protein NH26_13630 [Flammeovirga pacifica]